MDKFYATTKIKVHYPLSGTHSTTVQNAEDIGNLAQDAWNYLAARGSQIPRFRFTQKAFDYGTRLFLMGVILPPVCMSANYNLPITVRRRR